LGAILAAPHPYKIMTIKEKKKLLGSRTRTLYWHVHHEVLLEYCWDPKERKYYIKKDKPALEIPIRLRAFKRVKKPLNLPDRVLERVVRSGQVSNLQMSGRDFAAVMKQHRREYPNCHCNRYGCLVHKNGKRFAW
jgi:hypothetical protein